MCLATGRKLLGRQFLRLTRVVLLISVLTVLFVLTPAIASQPGKQLRLALPTFERGLTPYTYKTGFPGWNIMTLIYDTLLLLDTDLIPQPWLAEDVQVSEDGLTWTLKLREGIRWHDGKFFTSADVKFTVELFQKVAHGRFSPPLRGVTVQTPDPRTVIFQLSSPRAIFDLTLADVPIMPKHIWEGVADPKTFANNIGTGPYRLVEIVPDQFYRLEGNPNYFAGQAAVDTLILPIIPDPTATFTALQVGQIDAAARTVPPELVAPFLRNPDIKVLTGPGFVSTLLLFNNERPPFNDVRFRRVIAGLIDYTELVRTILLGFGTVGSPGFIHPDSPWYNAKLTGYERLTTTQAAAELDALGFKDTNGDGIREFPDGRPLKFTVLVYSTSPIRIRTAELISQAVKPAGIVFDVRALDPDTVDKLVWPDFDACKGRDYDLAMWGWSAPVMVRAEVRGLFHSDCKVGTINIVGYKNPEIDSLVEQQFTTADRTRRKQLLDQIQAIVARDLPFITLFYEDRTFAFRPAAYDGWVFQKGEGIINKLSLIRRK